MGVKIGLISYAFVSIGMLVCFRSSASSLLTTLPFCVPFQSLSKRPSCVKMLPRYLNYFTCLNLVPLLMLMARWPGVLITVIVSVLLKLVFLSYASMQHSDCSCVHA